MAKILVHNLNSCSQLQMRIFCTRNILRNICLNSKQLVEVKTKPLVVTQNENASQKPELGYNTRVIKLEDIPKIMETRKKLNSHDCYSCLQTWMKVDPEGIFVAEGKRGHIIGTGAFVQNSDEIYTGGLVYVDPQVRSSGIAREIMLRGLEHIQDKNICGNSVESMVNVYSTVFQGTPRENFTLLRNVTSNNVDFELLSEDLPPDVVLQPFQDSHLNSVNEYDSKLMGCDRSRLLELNCKEENSRTFVALNCGKCVGFGSVKLSCLGAARVGPLYADDAVIAEALLKNLLKSFPQGKGFMMMTLSNNVKANSLMTKLTVPTTQKLIQVFKTGIVEVDTDKIYAHFDVNFCVF